MSGHIGTNRPWLTPIGFDARRARLYGEL